MISIRVSGQKKYTDVFFRVMNDLVSNGVLACELKDKEYFNVEFLKPADKEPVARSYMVSARITADNMMDITRVVNIFRNIGSVYHKGETNSLDARKKKGKYVLMVCLMSVAEEAKQTTMQTLNEEWKKF